MKKYKWLSLSLRIILFFAAPGLTLSCKKHHEPAVARVSSLAGSGTFGYADGPAASAQFAYPSSIALDGQGNMYVADPFNQRIRKVTPSGLVSTLAGSGVSGFADGSGGAAQFNTPYGVACDANGNVYVADTYNHRIRKITPAGVVSTLAGDGTSGYHDGPGVGARFNNPTGVACDINGNVYVADQGQNLVRKITPSGVVTTLAGSSLGYFDGTGTAARFYACWSVACDRQSNVYVTDRENQRIRKITQAGVVTTLAGDGVAGDVDGPGADASFRSPRALTCDAAGNVYVADEVNNRIRKITPAGVVSTYAGSVDGFADGVAGDAQFSKPYGVACDSHGNIYVADYQNSKIRKISYQ